MSNAQISESTYAILLIKLRNLIKQLDNSDIRWFAAHCAERAGQIFREHTGRPTDLRIQRAIDAAYLFAGNPTQDNLLRMLRSRAGLEKFLYFCRRDQLHRVMKEDISGYYQSNMHQTVVYAIESATLEIIDDVIASYSAKCLIDVVIDVSSDLDHVEKEFLLQEKAIQDRLILKKQYRAQLLSCMVEHVARNQASLSFSQLLEERLFT